MLRYIIASLLRRDLPVFFMGHKFSKFRSSVVSNGELTQLTAQCTENLRLIK